MEDGLPEDCSTCPRDTFTATIATASKGTEKQMKMWGLEPGDVLTMPEMGMSGTLIAKMPAHPLYPTLSMFVWRLSDGELMLDALSPHMEVQGTVDSSNRVENLRTAVHYPKRRKKKRK